MACMNLKLNLNEIKKNIIITMSKYIIYYDSNLIESG